jgi:hypothetical protein
MKKCFKCNEVKELSEFYPHKKMADGHLNKCKECTKKDSEENFKRKLQDPDWQIKERERQRIKEARRRDLGLAKKYKKTPQPKEKRKERYGEYLSAIKTKKLIPQPCEVCGKEKAQGHHEDYSKSLDVVWLCIRHHQDRHIHLRNAKTLNEESMPINQFIKTMKLAGNFPL